MPYEQLPTKAQSDLLGPNFLRSLSSNLGWLRYIASQEHIVSTGEHNAWEVPRVCRRITSPTTVSPASSDITLVTNPVAGTYVLTLAASRFSGDMRLQINPCGDPFKPYLPSYRVLSTTSIEVYMKKLTSALGVAGNTWAATNSDFDIAIHSAPLAQTAWNSMPVLWNRGDAFEDRATGWNTLVQESAEIQRMLIAAHTTSGAHNVREVGKKYGLAQWDSAGVSYRATGSLTSVGRGGAGIVLVNHAALTLPISAFVCPDYQRYSSGSATDIFVCNAIQASTTQHVVYCYRWDPINLWWQYADTDLFIAFYGS